MPSTGWLNISQQRTFLPVPEAGSLRSIGERFKILFVVFAKYAR